MNLSQVSDRELQREIERRKTVRKMPSPLPNPNIEELTNFVDRIIREAAIVNYWDKDDEECIFYKVLTTLYGDAMVNWLNTSSFYLDSEV